MTLSKQGPTPRPGILDIDPYIPGASKAPGVQKIYKLSSNESALGASPKAIAAYQKIADDMFLYPDGGANLLRDKIADTYALKAAQIVCGAGSDEILQLLCKAYVGEGDNIVQSDHGFLVYALAAKSCGAEPRFAPEKNLTTDIDTMLTLVDEKTRIVFIANPNNPTGSYIPGADLHRLREALRDDIILVIDAAYSEYMEEPDYEDGAAMVEAHDNVVMTRTFSKIYGLAALRLGWGYCPPAIADVLNRIRGPFNVTAAAQAAGIGALEDQGFVERNRAFNRKEREWLTQQLGGLGLETVPSFGNFVLIKFPDRPGINASDILAFLKSEGVMVREMSAYKLPDYLRISIGEEEGNRKVIDLLERKFSRD
ncbi:MAG: histidinol-phosphate aminotransferase [Hyphococcus sp.]|nr:MAG: histidinol-phosphate aminotransferase [Marinicaulis sp.]